MARMSIHGRRLRPALERMPAAAGMALGLDRLAMVLCDTTSIEDVIAFCEPT